MNLESDKRLNIQLRLDFPSAPSGEARQAGREDIESLSAVNDPERPANTSSNRVSATSRTAVYGPVRTVVWEGRSREAPPYPDLLHEIGGTGKQHAPSILDQSEPERCRQMALAAARWTEEQDIGAFLQPGVAGRQRHHLRFRDHWHGLEVEGGERLAGGQPRLEEMPLEAAAAAISHLVLGEHREEAGRRPTFLIGLLGELGPHQSDARQA